MSVETFCEEINIYNNPEATKQASNYIHNNQVKAYLGTCWRLSTSYYNVNGIVWEAWHEGLGTYPVSYGQSVEDFKLPSVIP